MIAPSKLDIWYAEAVIRVYEPWLTSTCIGIGTRQRHEVADLVARARSIAGRPSMDRRGARGVCSPVRRA